MKYALTNSCKYMNMQTENEDDIYTLGRLSAKIQNARVVSRTDIPSAHKGCKDLEVAVWELVQLAAK